MPTSAARFRHFPSTQLMMGLPPQTPPELNRGQVEAYLMRSTIPLTQQTQSARKGQEKQIEVGRIIRGHFGF